MEAISIRSVVEAVKGRWLGAEPLLGEILQVNTDSRTVCPGTLFVPLQGKTFNGRSYIGEALGRGARAALLEPGPALDLPAGSPLIEVDSVLAALERLAVYWSGQVGAEIFAITGTVGKTTTKEFLGTLLATRFATVRAPRSFNNRLGVALTLLAAIRGTRYLVCEMGTSAHGELGHLSRLVRPQRVIVTEIGLAHCAGLGGLEGVIRAKSEIFEGLRPEGRAFIPESAAGRPELEAAARRAGADVVLFGWGSGDYTVRACRRLQRGDVDLPAGQVPVGFRFRVRDPRGHEEEFILPLPGRHNVLNALAAIAAARDAGIDWAAIRAGVRELELPPRRFGVTQVGGVTLVDDTYNASRRSVLAALEEAAEISLPAAGARRFFVLGDLLEMGSLSGEVHGEIGRRAVESGQYAGLIAVGAESRQAAAAARAACAARAGAPFRIEELARPEDAAALLREIVAPGDLVLFKASRGIGLDRAVDDAREWLSARALKDTVIQQTISNASKNGGQVPCSTISIT